MNGNFFVMLYHPEGKYLPLENEDDEMMFFITSEYAREAAESSLLGSEFGYEIFEIGTGE